jgi:hypothetical protein
MEKTTLTEGDLKTEGLLIIAFLFKISECGKTG